MSDSSTDLGYEVIGEVKRYIAEWHNLTIDVHGSFYLWADDPTDAETRALHSLIEDYEYNQLRFDLPLKTNGWQIVVREVTT